MLLNLTSPNTYQDLEKKKIVIKEGLCCYLKS